MADALLLVNKRYKKHETDSPLIDLTRGDLANIVGTATESLIRTLGDLKNENLIDIMDGKIVIRDEAKLAQIFN